jgi:2-methylisocitrate lyase-like PEP mutase family enzyme
MKTGISRRGFGKTLGAGAISGLMTKSVSSLAADQTTSSPKRMTTVLRELIKGPGIIAAPGIYDPISARIAESLGFRALDLPGSALGYASGVMEPNLCLEDMAEATRRIASVVNIPVVVDVGAGFGEPAHVMRTVRLL